MRVSKLEGSPIPGPVRANSAGPYRVAHDDDAVWRPRTRAYGGSEEETPYTRALAYARIAARLALPVLLLFTLLQAIYLFTDAPVPQAWLPGFAQGQFLILSDLILPGCWRVIHLTNRRFGPDYAFGNLVAGMALALVVAVIDPWDVRTSLPDQASLSTRAVAAFVLVFAAANFTGVIFFDAAQGPRWWTAPLVGSVAASFFFSGLYDPLAFGRLCFEALTHFALFLGVSPVLMLPYFLLRPTMKPMSGMNGY